MNYNQQDYNEDYWKNKKQIETKHYLMIAEWIRWLAPTQVLDYGCGFGQYTKVFVDMQISVVGYEPSEFAADHGHIVPYTKPEDIPRKGYDLVICIDVLEHLTEAEIPIVLSEIYDHCTKFAIFSICFKNDDNFSRDTTHKTARMREWWEYQLRQVGFFINTTPYEWLYSHQIIFVEKRKGDNNDCRM